eukprot:COSAG02_NODE_49708_length_325_cov_0.685841_1_plen_69_part_10
MVKVEKIHRFDSLHERGVRRSRPWDSQVLRVRSSDRWRLHAVACHGKMPIVLLQLQKERGRQIPQPSCH